MLAADGRHPYTELMALLPNMPLEEQAKVWLTLLSYCQAKPREVAPDDDNARSEISKLPLAELIQLIKQATEPKNADKTGA